MTHVAGHHVDHVFARGGRPAGEAERIVTAPLSDHGRSGCGCEAQPARRRPRAAEQLVRLAERDVRRPPAPAREHAVAHLGRRRARRRARRPAASPRPGPPRRAARRGPAARAAPAAPACRRAARRCRAAAPRRRRRGRQRGEGEVERPRILERRVEPRRRARRRRRPRAAAARPPAPPSAAAARRTAAAARPGRQAARSSPADEGGEARVGVERRGLLQVAVAAQDQRAVEHDDLQQRGVDAGEHALHRAGEEPGRATASSAPAPVRRCQPPASVRWCSKSYWPWW